MSISIRKSESSHYYWPNGTPCFELPKKSGNGMKRTTLADARELGLLPSVTTILKIIHKQGLQDWLIMQAVKAVMTVPRLKDEKTDDFLERVLVKDRVQDMESGLAARRGTDIHAALESAIQGEAFDDTLRPYIEAVFPILESLGKVVWSEKVLVGDGYAGKGDVALENDQHIAVIDFKSVGKATLPMDSWPEHRMQLAAYAKAIGNTADKHILIGNIYISTVTPGLVNLCLNEDWSNDYDAFMNAKKLWEYMNKYKVDGVVAKS